MKPKTETLITQVKRKSDAQDAENPLSEGQSVTWTLTPIPLVTVQGVCDGNAYKIGATWFVNLRELDGTYPAKAGQPPGTTTATGIAALSVSVNA